MKYIDFESWTVTWLHEGNVIVEDQLTHNFKRRSRTSPPKAVPYAAVQNVSKAGDDSVLSCPWRLTSRFMETWLVEIMDSIVAVVYVFVYSVVKCVGLQPITRIVQPIVRRSRFCSGALKIQQIEEFSLGFEGNGKFRKIYSSASCP